MNDKIRQLQQQISKEEEAIRRCDHDFKEPVYDPEPYKEPIFSHYDGGGSDPNPIYNYVDRTKDRWSRECKKCGKFEYTYTQAPVINSYKPKFNS